MLTVQALTGLVGCRRETCASMKALGARVPRIRHPSGDWHGIGGPSGGKIVAEHPGSAVMLRPDGRMVRSSGKCRLRTCRAIAAEEIARGGLTDAAKAATVRRINARFPYTNPTGIKDIVSDSVEGLFREFSQPSSTPLP